MNDIYKIYGTLQKHIATGVYGKVYKTNKDYALKIFDQNDRDGDLCDFIREITSLRLLNHPNIIKPLKVTLIKNCRRIYMPLAECTLNDIMSDKNNRDPPELFIYQLLQALNHCHRHNIIHRDVKPTNILIYPNNLLKLADFGMSKFLIAGGDTHTNTICALWWRAPEVLLGKCNYNSSIDIWSVGVILFDFLTRSELLHGKLEQDQLYRIFELLGSPTEQDWPGVTQLEKWTDSFSTLTPKKIILPNQTTGLLDKMLVWEPHRISASEALMHSYFDSVRDDMYLEKVIESESNKILINVEYRKILFEWLWKIFKSFNLKYTTLFLAYNIFDRLSEKINIDKKKLLGYGAASIQLAVKLYEIYNINIDDLIYLSYDEYTRTELWEYEKDILNQLDYDLLRLPYNLPLEQYKLQAQELEITSAFLVAFYFNYKWIAIIPAAEGTQIVYNYLYKKDTGSVIITKEMLTIYFESLNNNLGKYLKELFKKINHFDF